MTTNRDKTNILNKSKNKKEKRIKPEQGMWTIWDNTTDRRERGDEKERLEFR